MKSEIQNSSNPHWRAAQWLGLKWNYEIKILLLKVLIKLYISCLAVSVFTKNQYKNSWKYLKLEKKTLQLWPVSFLGDTKWTQITTCIHKLSTFKSIDLDIFLLFTKLKPKGNLDSKSFFGLKLTVESQDDDLKHE